MLRVLTLSTLFPDAASPAFGVFVARQVEALAVLPDTAVRVVAPVGLPPWPASRLRHYAARQGLPRYDIWAGVPVDRPRFPILPGTGGRFHARALAATLVSVLSRIRREFAFDVIDASFFFPDGPAAVALGRRFGVPVSIKARGADIHHWGNAP
ncbi:MAG TPA: glycosyltransferase family 4 protein, partial [Sphingomonas sp.]